MRRLAALTLVTTAISIGACGDDSAESPPDPRPPMQESGKAPNPRGDERTRRDMSSDTFRRAKEECSLFPIGEIASEYGGDPSDPESVADAYAKATAQPAVQDEARAGCLVELR